MHCYRLCQIWAMPLLLFSTVLFAIGLVGGLYYAPEDYQMRDAVRIIYIHVPSAAMSMFVYMVMAGAGLITLIWRVKLADVVARASAPLGASFTVLALATGSLWGKPMWGTWWVWDGRLTSELILLFLYMGYMALQSAIEDRRVAARAGAVLALIGSVNIPIIHYSVEWWNTLHQAQTNFREMDQYMRAPLGVMFAAFQFYFIAVVLLRLRCEILEFDRNSSWVKELVTKEPMQRD
jgi:heme exporter protein C